MTIILAPETDPIMLSPKFHLPPLKSDSIGFRPKFLIGSCNGFICLLSGERYDDNHSVYISNPLLGEYFKVKLPEWEKRVRRVAYGFCFSEASGLYKVLRSVTRKFGGLPEVSELEVYTLGIDEKWRNVGEAPYPFMWIIWLPVNSLIRFKCLSKFYNSLVSDPSFVDIHHSHSTSRPHKTKFLARSRDKNFFYTIDQEVEHKEATVLRIEELDGIEYYRFDYVNGLFFLWSIKEHPPAIYNPTTRIVKYLPFLNSIDDAFTMCYYSFGFEPVEKKYKILMSRIPADMNSPERQWVLTLGPSESWREIKSAPCSLSLLVHVGVCIEGAIYFVGTRNKTCIVAFDVRTENFRMISLWNNVIDISAKYFYNLIEVKGKLAVIDRSRWNGVEMDLRILQSCGTGEWVKQTIVFPEAILSSLTMEYFGWFCSSTPDGEVVFITLEQNWIVFYDLKKKSWRKISIPELAENVEIIGSYSHIDSLLSCIYC
ncbi:hypothetical protein HAX54_045825 [Datura stramonium]|uniref:F-box associated beta-propeller type 3 domain-containing protein n=1 Tax=Datura stramonium TaxID=4076 RepID=A0ABS8SQV9_DATST|nr:hypothetical protein [Datura stramonium]